MDHKDLTKFVPELKKALPFFIPGKIKDVIIDAFFMVLCI